MTQFVVNASRVSKRKKNVITTAATAEEMHAQLDE